MVKDRPNKDYVPILEDDEGEIEMGPILPQFSPRKNSSNMQFSPDDIYQIPLAQEKNLVKEVDDDFKVQFEKDTTELKPDNLILHCGSSKPKGSLKHEEDDNSSPDDYSTGSSYESDYISDEENLGNRIKKASSSTAYMYKVETPRSSIDNMNRTRNNYVGTSSSLNLPTSTSHEHKLLEDALTELDNHYSGSQPSSILRWINNIPKKLSIGQAARSSNKGNHLSDVEEYDLTNMERQSIDQRPNRDLESGTMKRSSSSRNILQIANNLMHGKPVKHLRNRGREFDEILDDYKSKREYKKEMRDDDELINGGLTSNLMRLYNQIPYSSADDLFSESDADDDILTSDNGMLHSNKTKKVGERVRKFKNKNNHIFGSRESSREPKRDERRHTDGNESIKLPDFSLGKKDKMVKKIKKRSKQQMAARITVHIFDLIHREEFLLKLCKAFMLYGAPNHRLEEYMSLTANVLEVDATFIYLPGMMLVNFSDPVSKTSDLKLVRVGQGLNLNKLDLSHDIYESVVHDRTGVDVASKELDDLFESKEFLNTYWMILFYGLSSMTVLVFFGGSWLDMIPSFLLGSMLGFLECVVAPRNAVYSSIYEVGSAVLISFVGRAIGSIGGGRYFCFSAVVLSGLCMILPGYMILRGALEIQSKSIVSGVVGMFYAIIYSLFLGFGLTLGSALYGWMDENAYDKTTCSNIGHIGNVWKLLLVPLFNICLSLACQARFHQLSVMVSIACAGYVVTYFSSLHFTITQFNSALGSFTIGLLSNFYDRYGRSYKRFGYCSTKFSSMICGVFDLVPGGFAARNVLSSGLSQLSGSDDSGSSVSVVDTSTFAFGLTMIEIAIGITVGLFVSTLVVHGSADILALLTRLYLRTRDSYFNNTASTGLDRDGRFRNNTSNSIGL